MAHTPGTERDHLVDVRTSSSNLLVEQIRTLKETIANKDEQLLGYEQNLAQLMYDLLVVSVITLLLIS